MNVLDNCATCLGRGYVFSCNECGDDEVQRCDECAMYESDDEAQAVEQRG